jgi:hypothetical protein
MKWCSQGFCSKINMQALVEAIVGKSHGKSKFNKKIIQLHCTPPEEHKNNTVAKIGGWAENLNEEEFNNLWRSCDSRSALKNLVCLGQNKRHNVL